MSQSDTDAVRTTVRERYATVAKGGEAPIGRGEPQEQSQGGCCAPACCGGGGASPSLKIGYSAEELAQVPDGADLGLGCGNPQAIASLATGETVLDLGAGGGFDAFLAARAVGPTGRVIGVDMTAEMVAKARANAAKAGVGNVEFRLGEIERLPVADRSVDAIMSNCVINLSPDKPKVFREIWRVLRDHGRVVVADIVAGREVPTKMRADGQLWGECISGALTEEAFLAGLERAGFHGVSILKKTFWREVEDCRFYSVTARGYKFEKKAGCTYVGQYAVYLGPLKATIDEEGHLFPRGTPVEVCTDTAAKLSHAPYAGSFAVVDGPSGHINVDGDAGCTPGSGCC
jgi:SAM-dependent methyltransferase